MRSNLDKAREAHEYLGELRGKRDAWIYAAGQDGHSVSEIARSLGLSRRRVRQVLDSLAAPPALGDASLSTLSSP